MSKIFISYARADGSEIADELADRLRALGHDVFLDTHSLTGGSHWRPELSRYVKWAELVIVLITEASNNSDHVYQEVDQAARQKKVILPVQVNETPLPVHLRGTWQAVKFQGDNFDGVLLEIEHTIRLLPKSGLISPRGRIALSSAGVIAMLLLAIFLLISFRNNNEEPDQTDVPEVVLQSTENIVSPTQSPTQTATDALSLTSTSTVLQSVTVTQTQPPRPTNTPKSTVAPTLTPTEIPVSAILYEDDFEDGTADGWFQGERWRVVTEANNKVYSGTGLYEAAFLKPIGWENYVVEMRLKMESGGMGIYFRSTGYDNGYVLEFEEDNTVVFMKKEPTANWFWSYYFPTPREWITIHVELDGQVLRVNIDGQWYPEVQDDAFLSGGLGIFTSASAANTVQIDDVRIWSLGPN